MAQNIDIFSKEEARNPEPEARIKCSECSFEAGLDRFLKEDSLPHPYENIVEGYTECPNCRYVKHIYFMSPVTRNNQFRLQKVVEDWHKTKSNTSFDKMLKIKTLYKKMFDKDQQEYAFLLDRGK